MEYTIAACCLPAMHINAFIVYALCDARTHRIRYIGSSEIGLARPVTTRGYKNHPELYTWLHDLTVCGSEHVVLVLAEARDIAELRAYETFWIGQGKRFGWPLLNRAGFTLDIEAKEPDPGPKSKKWQLRDWRCDPEVKNRLAAARESKKRK